MLYHFRFGILGWKADRQNGKRRESMEKKQERKEARNGQVRKHSLLDKCHPAHVQQHVFHLGPKHSKNAIQH